MSESFEIGVSLALSDGVSEGMAQARRDMAQLEHVLRAGAVSLSQLRQSAVSALAVQRPAQAVPRIEGRNAQLGEAAPSPVLNRSAQTRLDPRPDPLAEQPVPAPGTVQAASAPVETLTLPAFGAAAAGGADVPALSAGRERALPSEVPTAPGAGVPSLVGRQDILSAPARRTVLGEASASPAAPVAPSVPALAGLDETGPGPDGSAPGGFAAAPGTDTVPQITLVRLGQVVQAARPTGDAQGMPPVVAGVSGAADGAADGAPDRVARAPAMAPVVIRGQQAGRDDEKSPQTLAASGPDAGASAPRFVFDTVPDQRGPVPGSVEQAQAPYGALSAEPNEGSSGRAGGAGGQAPAAPQAAAPASGPTEGDVYLDGLLVGRWMSRFLAKEAGRASVGPTGFDPRRGRLMPGPTVGG